VNEMVLPSSARVRYSKVVGACLVFVIVDIHPDGCAEFWSQESGEVRWFPFVPAPAERLAAFTLLGAQPGEGGGGWPLLRFAADVAQTC